MLRTSLFFIQEFASQSNGVSGSDGAINLSAEVEPQLRALVCGSPRELSGWVLTVIDQTLGEFEGQDSASFVEKWYRSADVASYNTPAAAAAYLGGYGPRSILKYQESVFALHVMKGSIRRHTRVLDYGCGPCIGFAGLVDLWNVFAEFTGEQLSLEYVGVDRSRSMLNVGAALCQRVTSWANCQTSYRLLEVPEFDRATAHLLIVSNVMNDGEGNLNCREFLTAVVSIIDDLEDIVVIEPATEQPARQMCGLAAPLGPFQHVGPCPSSGSICTEWSFRQFPKRVYDFERRCLGIWASAARTCKFSLALLSSVLNPRALPRSGGVVVGRRSSAGFVGVCRFGQKRVMGIEAEAVPWDTVGAEGRIKRWWP